MQLNEGEVICNKCDGAGAIAKKHHSDGIITVDCPKCYGTGKTDWVTNAMKEIKKPSLYHPNPVPIMTADPDDAITFYYNGKATIELKKDGFYIKGNKIADDKKIYKAFVQFLKNAGVYK